MTPSKVPCIQQRNQISSVLGTHGTPMVAMAPPSRQTAIIRSQNKPNLSTRTPPRADPMKYPALLPDTAVATSS